MTLSDGADRLGGGGEMTRIRAGLFLCLVVVLASMAGMVSSADAAQVADSQGWQRKTPPLTTPWTDQVGPHNAHPEYPRPQLARDRWLNLNGVWQYGAGGAAPVGRDPGERILVPYPPESALSGIERHDDTMWYRRTFTVPKDWRGQRVLLNFGAVNEEAAVLVNGRPVATHRGGYASFSVDVTDALRPGGPQELVVGATSRVENGDFPIGKQRIQPGGILYTASSGIWQTVWAEPVPAAHVTQLDITPNLAASGFQVTPRVSGLGGRVTVTATDAAGKVVARSAGMANAPQFLRIPGAHLWSPDSPYLYHFTATTSGGDRVRSYAGLRQISIVRDAKGRPRMALNGKILFQHGPLDQGFWPDGIYTAPTDDALRSDIEQTKALGFNMIRKHTKVEPDRWYYWADTLGVLVWQDMPALPIDLAIPPGQEPAPTPAMRANYEQGLHDLIDQHRSVTSIVVWVPFNEGWGEFDTARVAAETKRLDPARLVDIQSGVNCCYSQPDTGAGDIYDDHTYVGPGTPAVHDRRVIVDGEYGGLGLVLDGHVWPGKPQAYEMESSAAQLTARYVDVSEALQKAVVDNGLSAAVYTQTTDVEDEVNGFLTYDRRVMKPDPKLVRQHNIAVIAAGTGE